MPAAPGALQRKAAWRLERRARRRRCGRSSRAEARAARLACRLRLARADVRERCGARGLCLPGGPALAAARRPGRAAQPAARGPRQGRGAQVPGCGLGGARCRLGATPRGDYVCCGSDGGGVFVYSAAGERAAHVLQNKVPLFERAHEAD